MYSFYDEELDCKFHNIDCGCAYKAKFPTAKLACIRLEDEKIYSKGMKETYLEFSDEKIYAYLQCCGDNKKLIF